jgi:adenosylcobinamide-GDP ribazoletransferase
MYSSIVPICPKEVAPIFMPDFSQSTPDVKAVSTPNSIASNFNSFLAAITFYTCFPIPPDLQLDFSQIARWAPVVGVCLGFSLGGVDLGLDWLQMPSLVRSSLLVAIWLWWTGGLHLDGAMDAADGLAVQDPDRRLTVMADSVTGAFGAMAAIVVMMLKVCALSEIGVDRIWVMMLVAGWSRWGQVLAIALYPYLKLVGKGAFHRRGLNLPVDVLLGLAIVLGVTGGWIYLQPIEWLAISLKSAASCGIAVVTGYYFHHRFGGHTGDTYGAIVEWTETFCLCLFAIP